MDDMAFSNDPDPEPKSPNDPANQLQPSNTSYETDDDWKLPSETESDASVNDDSEDLYGTPNSGDDFVINAKNAGNNSFNTESDYNSQTVIGIGISYGGNGNGNANSGGNGNNNGGNGSIVFDRCGGNGNSSGNCIGNSTPIGNNNGISYGGNGNSNSNPYHRGNGNTNGGNGSIGIDRCGRNGNSSGNCIGNSTPIGNNNGISYGGNGNSNSNPYHRGNGNTNRGNGNSNGSGTPFTIGIGGDDNLNANGTITVSAGMRFETEMGLMAHMNAMAFEQGFKICKRTTYYSDEKAKELFSTLPTEDAQLVIDHHPADQLKDDQPLQVGKHLQYGFFYCSGTKKVACKWKVPFSYYAQRKEEKGYYIKPRGLVLQHCNHAAVNVPYNGKICIDCQEDLLPKEIDWLQSFAIHNENSGMVRERMNALFSPRMFTPALVSRQLTKLKKATQGNTGMCMGRLMEIGHGLIQSGGLFILEHDGSMRLSSVIVQSKQMRKYAEVYNDFCILDGTHGTNQYKLILMPVTLVDCFGKSVISAIGINESETKLFSEKLMKETGHANNRGTLMTDEGSAFTELCSLLDMTHVLCSFHFQKKINDVSGLGEEREAVRKILIDLIYVKYETENLWHDEYNALYQKMEDQANESVLGFMKGMWKKVVFAISFTHKNHSLCYHWCYHCFTKALTTWNIHSVIKACLTKRKRYAAFGLKKSLLVVTLQLQELREQMSG